MLGYFKESMCENMKKYISKCEFYHGAHWMSIFL